MNRAQRQQAEYAAEMAGGVRVESEPGLLRGLAGIFSKRLLSVSGGLALGALLLGGPWAALMILGGASVYVSLAASWQVHKAATKGVSNFVHGMYQRKTPTDGPGMDGPSMQMDTPGAHGPSSPDSTGPRTYTLSNPQSQKYLEFLNRAYNAKTIEDVQFVVKMTAFQPAGADTSPQAVALRGVLNELGTQTTVAGARALIDARMAPIDKAAAEVASHAAQTLRPQHPRERDRERERGERQPVGRGQNWGGGPGQQEFILGPESGGMNPGAHGQDIS